MKSFPLEAKSFRNTATCQKTQGRGFINPLPPPPALYNGSGVCLCVYVRGYLIHLSVRSLLTRACLLPLIRTRPLINRLIEKLWQKSSIEGNESAILGMKPMGQATKTTHQLELANLPNVQHWSALRLLIDLTARSHWKFWSSCLSSHVLWINLVPCDAPFVSIHNWEYEFLKENRSRQWFNFLKWDFSVAVALTNNYAHIAITVS